MIRRLALSLLALCFAGAALGQTYRPGFGFSRPGFQFLSAGGGAAVGTLWNSADKAASVALTNGGTTAATSMANTTGGVRGVTGRASTGDYTYSVTLAVAIDSDSIIGIALASWPLGDANLAGFHGLKPSTGGLYTNDPTPVTSYGAMPVGTVLQFKLKAGTLSILKNGAALTSLVGLPAGTYYPALRTFSGSGAPYGTFTHTAPVLDAGSAAWN